MKQTLCAIALLVFSVTASAKPSKKATEVPVAPVAPKMTYASDSAEYNFRFSPIGLIVGSINIGLDIVVAPDWTVGPAVQYWRYKISSDDTIFSSDYEITAYSFGGRANWFKNGNFTDGLYVGPSLSYASVKLTTKDSLGDTVTGSASVMLASCLVGYGWYWDSFNMMLGGGAALGLGDTKVKVETSSGSTTEVSSSIAGVALEYSLGWTF